MSVEHFDVIIVGAGLSGIGAAYHLQSKCPGKSYCILEGRAAMGGTWDLFRYPGIRSDSDMYTLGYSFKPWTEAKSIADGPSILRYIRETASENAIEEHIRYQQHVDSASWSSGEARWTVEAKNAESGALTRFSCNFLMMCSGYYNYDGGYQPEFGGEADFKGQLIHPQAWPEDLDYEDKEVVVIGSGATAVTLVPEMAKRAAKVTMLQRSPTYMGARPSEDAFANWLRTKLPARLAYAITRWKNVLLGLYFFNYTRRHPEKVADMLIHGVSQQLPEDYDVEKHFRPRYNPWDQRLCLVPDGDMFKAISQGSVAVVTDQISRLTADGVMLESGKELPADIIVSATGLRLQLLSGVAFTVDGLPVEFPQKLTYKGLMFSDVPNLSVSMGYTNASWTLKCDLTCGYVCRLLNYMDRHSFDQCRPVNDRGDLEIVPYMELTSGYVQRGIDEFPKQASSKPWRLHQNYALDTLALGLGRVDDGTMEFSRGSAFEAGLELQVSQAGGS